MWLGQSKEGLWDLPLETFLTGYMSFLVFCLDALIPFIIFSLVNLFLLSIHPFPLHPFSLICLITVLCPVVFTIIQPSLCSGLFLCGPP